MQQVLEIVTTILVTSGSIPHMVSCDLSVIPNGSRVPLGGGSIPQAASVRLLNAVVSHKRAVYKSIVHQ